MSPETNSWWELGRALHISILELSEYEEGWFVSQERQTLEIMYNCNGEPGNYEMFAGGF